MRDANTADPFIAQEKGRRALTGYEPKLLVHMEMMRRRRSGRVSPGREAEESRAPAGEGGLVADEDKPEQNGRWVVGSQGGEAAGGRDAPKRSLGRG